MNIYLTNEIKARIINNIDLHIDKEYSKLDIMKKIRYHEVELANAIRGWVNCKYPKSEMDIIKKHNLHNSYTYITLYRTTANGIWIFASSYRHYANLIFEHPIEIPNSVKLEDIISENYLDEALSLMDMTDKVDYEKIKILRDATSKISKFKRLYPFMINLPQFKKFIPIEFLSENMIYQESTPLIKYNPEINIPQIEYGELKNA